MPDKRAPLDRSQALARLASHPALPELITTLAPRTLTRLYAAVGLHDAGALMEATPPELLARALTEAVWHEDGRPARFDADVFVDWLEVWLDAGEAFAAERLCALDEDTLTLAFAELLRVEDSHVTGFCREPDDPGELLDLDDCTDLFGHFLVAARQPDEWDLARGALLALWSHDPDFLLALLTRLSVAAAHASRRGGERLHDDAAAARDSRREQEGFVGPQAARAFLGMATALGPEALAGMQAYDEESARHLRRLMRAAPADADAAGSDAEPDRQAAELRSAESADGGAAELRTLLILAGIADGAPARLGAPARKGSSTLEQRLQALAAADPAALGTAAAELAYLANVLRSAAALVESTATDADERARSLAMAVSNLGLELLEGQGVTITPGREPGLVQPFLAGWRTLLELPARLSRCLQEGAAAAAVQQRLAARPWLAAEFEQSLDDLAQAVARQDFAAAREAMGLLSLVFDADACRAATHLLARPPAFPLALEGGDHRATRPLGNRAELTRVSALLEALRRGGVRR